MVRPMTTTRHAGGTGRPSGGVGDGPKDCCSDGSRRRLGRFVRWSPDAAGLGQRRRSPLSRPAVGRARLTHAGLDKGKGAPCHARPGCGIAYI